MASSYNDILKDAYARQLQSAQYQNTAYGLDMQQQAQQMQANVYYQNVLGVLPEQKPAPASEITWLKTRVWEVCQAW